MGLWEVCLPAPSPSYFTTIGCYALSDDVTHQLVIFATGSGGTSGQDVAFPLLITARVFALLSAVAAGGCFLLICIAHPLATRLYTTGICVTYFRANQCISMAIVSLLASSWISSAIACVSIASLELYLMSRSGAGLSTSWILCVSGGALALTAMLCLLPRACAGSSDEGPGEVEIGTAASFRFPRSPGARGKSPTKMDLRRSAILFKTQQQKAPDFGGTI